MHHCVSRTLIQQHSVNVVRGGKVKCESECKDCQNSDCDDDLNDSETQCVVCTVMTIFTFHCESYAFLNMFHEGQPAPYFQVLNSVQVDSILDKQIPGPEITIQELDWSMSYGSKVKVLFTSDSMMRPCRFDEVNFAEAH